MAPQIGMLHFSWNFHWQLKSRTYCKGTAQPHRKSQFLSQGACNLYRESRRRWGRGKEKHRALKLLIWSYLASQWLRTKQSWPSVIFKPQCLLPPRKWTEEVVNQGQKSVLILIQLISHNSCSPPLKACLWLLGIWPFPGTRCGSSSEPWIPPVNVSPLGSTPRNQGFFVFWFF